MAARSQAPDDFAAWVAPHLLPMAYLAARLVGAADRDDVVQEALTRAWKRRETFDASRGTPRTWLLAIVADRATRARRRRRRPGTLPDPPTPLVVDAADGTRVDLERALGALPARMRLAVDCFYFVGLTVSETAAVMGVSDGTVKSTLFDARAQLRDLLEVRT